MADIEKQARDIDARVHPFVDEYVLSTDGVDYEPTEHERALIEDALQGFVAENWLAFRDAQPVEGRPMTRDEHGHGVTTTVDPSDHAGLAASLKRIAWNSLGGYYTMDGVDVLNAADALVADGWQPIETAPKDGTPFLAGRAGGDVGSIIVARHKEKWPGFYSVPGEYHVKHTHWRPLPAPPQVQP